MGSYLILVNSGSARENQMFVNDVLAIYDDSEVTIGGQGYADFKVLKFNNVTKVDLEEWINATKGNVIFNPADNKTYWEEEPDVFTELIRKPKFDVCLRDVVPGFWVVLNTPAATKSNVMSVLASVGKACVEDQIDYLRA